MELTKKIADFVVNTSDAEIPHEAMDTAKAAILDGLGVTLAGSREPLGRLIAEYVRESGGRAKASVIGFGFKTSVAQAALANGTLAHIMDYDDATAGWACHPTAVLLPTILALGEAGHVSGQELLGAYVIGFEVATKMGINVNTPLASRGWHQTGVIGTMATAMAAARVLKLDTEKTAMALGIAASMAAGLRVNFGTMTKPLHAGNTARNGVVAASLAAKGFTANENILDVPHGFFEAFGAGEYDLKQTIGTLGNPFALVSPGLIIKIYPACRGTHRGIDAALYLKKKHRLSAKDIAEVKCITSDTIRASLIYSRPKTVFEAKFCLEYCVAVALLDGYVGLEHFTEARVLAPEVQKFLTRVKYLHPEELKGWRGRDFPETVVVTLKDGRQFQHSVDEASGAPSNPASQEQRLSKYRQCASLALSPAAVERSIELVTNLEQVKDIAKLAALVAAKTS